MASITTTLGLASRGDNLPTARTHVWTDEADTTCAVISFQVGRSEFGFNDRDEAVAYLAANGAAGLPVVYGTATAGDGGTATAGYGGTATAGYSGTATAGDRGRLVITWWDDNASRYRIAVGYVGEDGIEPDTAYRCDPTGQLVKAVTA